MKNKLLILSLAFATQFIAQPAFKLYNKSNGALVSPNQLIQMTTIQEDVVKYTFDIENTSGATRKYIVKRYDILLNNLALANFCFAGACYTGDKYQSPDSLKLNNLQKASELDATVPNSTLNADLTEYGPIGKSIVKYTILNAMNHADSAQVVISYNNAVVGIKEIATKNISAVSLYPNPAKEHTALKINSLKGGELQLNVYNLLGEVVHSEKINTIAGDNEIKLDTRSYSKGIYFVNVPDGNSVITRKLVIN